MESGVRPPLDSYCKYQIVYRNISIHIPAAADYIRKVWHYNRANNILTKRDYAEFSWHLHLINHDPSWQVKFFNETILNIMSNFIPNQYINVQPKDPPWINEKLKKMIKKQNRQYKSYVKDGCKPEKSNWLILFDRTVLMPLMKLRLNTLMVWEKN